MTYMECAPVIVRCQLGHPGVIGQYVAPLATTEKRQGLDNGDVLLRELPRNYAEMIPQLKLILVAHKCQFAWMVWTAIGMHGQVGLHAPKLVVLRVMGKV
jgi:hypothetical protein